MAHRTKSSLAAALSVAMADHGLESRTVLKVGFLAPLTGKLKSWAEPGLNGSLIWRDRVNAAGGIKVGMRRFMVDLVPFDTATSQVKLKPVVVSRFETERVVLNDGLVKGDIVVTAGVNRLREGQQVRLIDGAAQ